MSDPALDQAPRASRTTAVAARGSTVFVGFSGSSTSAADYGLSTDGGATFAHMRIPAPSGFEYYGSPSVAFGPAGEIYYAFTGGLTGDPSLIALAVSKDGGATFSPIRFPSGQVQNGYDSMSQPVVAVDTGASSRYKGLIYVAWTYTFTDYGINVLLLSVSSDGITFTNPFVLNNYTDGVHVSSPAVAIAPNGDLYVAYYDRHSSPAGITITKSVNGGVNFSSLKTVATIQPGGVLSAGGGGAFPDPRPSLAVDGSGAVHVAWAAVSSGSTADRSDVFYARSTDGGTTWSAARKLNDDGTVTTQAYPALAALPDGTVGVRWTDRRADAGRDAANEVAMAISRDGGATWGRSFRVSDRAAPWGPVAHAFGREGHSAYEGLAADAGGFYLAWTDERSGEPAVWAAAVPAAFDGSAPDFGLSASDTWASVAPGGSAAFDLAVAGANGFAGTVALAPDLAPAGLTLSLASPSAAPGQPVRLTVTASASAAPGDYVIGVAASGGGLVRGARMRVSVTDASRGVAPPVNVTRSPGFSTGAAKADSSGVLHAVVDDDSANVTGSDVSYRRSDDGGATFSAPVRLNAAGSVASQSAFAVDPTGRIFVAWSGRASGETSPRIYFTRSTDGGRTFATPLAVNGATGHALLPAVAADRNGNVVVAWLDVSNDTPVVGWSRSTNAGTSFSTPVPIFDSPAVITRPGLAIDSKNNAYLAWTRQTGGSVLRLAVSKAGGAFGGAATISDTTLYAYAPDLAVGPDDSLGVAFYTRAVVSNAVQNRRTTFMRSTNGGVAFSTPAVLSSASGQAFFPAAAFEPSGAIAVAWEEFDANDVRSDVFLARSTDGGATFSAPANLSQNGGLSGSAADPVDGLGGNGRAAVSAGANGTLVVSWADDAGSALDLLLSTPRAAAISNRPPVPAITSPAPGATVEAGAPVSFAGSASDPDGDPVALTWDFGDGKTATGPNPPARPYAVPGVYRVTLTARDPNGGTGTAALTVTVSAPSAGGAATALLVPVVLEASGLGGSRYTSEVTLVSRAGAPSEVVLSYTASAGSGSGFARLALAAGEMRVVPGFLEWLRGQGLPIPADGSTQVGTLVATFRGVSDASLVFAGARTFTADPGGGGGTFGLFAPAATGGPALTLVGLQQNASQRSNLAVVNAGGSPVVVRVSLAGPNGEDLGALPDLALGPWGWFQYNQPLAGKAASGRAVVARVSGSSPVTAYAVLNDAVTSDGSYVPPLFGDDGSGADRLVPIVLDVAGIGARFRTELTLTNLTSSPLALTLVYIPAFGSGSGTVPVTLAAGEQRIVPDAIAFLRGTLPIENDGRNVGGPLLVEAAPGTPGGALAVGARTFVPLAPSGSYGLFYPGLSLGECATGTAWVYGLQESAATRANLAVLNRGDAGDVVTLRVTFYASNGNPLGIPADVVLVPGGWFQFARPLAGLGAAAGYAKVERISGASRFAAYGVLNDNLTSDGSYVPMSF